MKKIVSIFLALCLMVLSVPFGAMADTAPAPEIKAFSWETGEEATEFFVFEDFRCNVSFELPEEAYINGAWGADVQFINSKGEIIDNFHFSNGQWDNGRMNCYYYFMAKDVSDHSIQASYWYDIGEGEEWKAFDSEVANQKITIKQRGALANLIVEPESEEILVGTSIKAQFYPDYETGDFPPWSARQGLAIRYMVKNSSGASYDIAPRGVGYHEINDAEERFFDRIQLTNGLEAGEYTLSAWLADKNGNYKDGAVTEKKIKVVDKHAEGVSIKADKEYYEPGDKATITVHCDGATSFDINIWDGKEGHFWDSEQPGTVVDGTFTYTTDTINWLGSINVMVLAVNGEELVPWNQANYPIRNNTNTITADKEEYVVGEKAKLSLSAFKAARFELELIISRADGSGEHRNEMVDADNGTASFEVELEEEETITIKSRATCLDEEGNPNKANEASILLKVVSPDEASITLVAPTDLKAAVGTTGAEISWTASENATGYVLERKVDDGKYSELATATGTSYTDTTVEKHKTYSYRVKATATNGSGEEFESAYSDDVQFRIPDADPIELKAPTGLKAEAAEGGVTVSWKASENAQKYELSRKVDDGEYALLATLDAPTVTYTDKTIEKGKTYTYRVVATATNADGVQFVSPASNDVQYKIPDAPAIELAAPTGVKLSTSGGTSIDLAWKGQAEAQKFIVSRKIGDGDYQVIAEVTEAKYTDKAVSTKKLYTYRIVASATNADGIVSYSDPSNDKCFWLLAKSKKLTATSTVASQINLKWKKVSGATSYEVYYTTSKKDKPTAETKDVKKAKSTSLTLKKLKAGKKYYVYVRAVKKLDNGITVRGPWSKVAKVTTLE